MNLAQKLTAPLFLAFFISSSPLFANPPVQILFITEPPSRIPVGANLTNILVQLVDKNGTFAAQSGYAISMSLNQASLGGITNAVTDTNGQAFFNDLVFSVVGTGVKLNATATGLKPGISSGFTVTKGATTTALASSTNLLVYGQSVVFTAAVASASPFTSVPTGTVTFSDGSTIIGTNALNAAGAATFTTNQLSATTSHNITAVYGGDANFLASTGTLVQAVIAPTTPPPPSKLSLAAVLANGTVTGQVSGTSGQTYVIQASTDLMNWISLYTNTADTNGVVFLVDSNSAAFSKRFYRAYSP